METSSGFGAFADDEDAVIVALRPMEKFLGKQLEIDRRQTTFKKGGDKACVSDYMLLAIDSVFRKSLCTVK